MTVFHKSQFKPFISLWVSCFNFQNCIAIKVDILKIAVTTPAPSKLMLYIGLVATNKRCMYVCKLPETSPSHLETIQVYIINHSWFPMACSSTSMSQDQSSSSHPPNPNTEFF